VRIGVFTSGEPRHIWFSNRLLEFASNVNVIAEKKTIPASHQTEGEGLNAYYSRMKIAEKELFGSELEFSTEIQLSTIQRGSFASVEKQIDKMVRDSDLILVFGSSFIKGDLCKKLIERRAINIHLGIAPFYRGSACNFWAMYDGRYDLVGATGHFLTEGLDDGPIIFHAFSEQYQNDPFQFTMGAVKAASFGLEKVIQISEVFNNYSQKQDDLKLLRHSKRRDFTSQIASQFLRALPSQKMISHRLSLRDLSAFQNPLFY